MSGEYTYRREKKLYLSFLVFLLFRSASESTGIFIFCILNLDIIAVFPVKLGAVLTVKGFGSRGVGCNTRAAS